MKASYNIAFLAPAFFAVVAGDVCEPENVVTARATVVTSAESTVNSTAIANSTSVANDTTAVYAAVPLSGVDTHSAERVILSTDLPVLPYASNATDTIISVNHTMRYPSVLLESISSISNVDCSDTSVALTFNDSSIFEAAVAAWDNKTLVLVTNHMGDCDAELERGFFLVDTVTFDSENLIATASSSKTDVNSTAAYTEIYFGQPSTGSSNLTTRDITLNPSYTFSNAVALPSTVLYSYDPYLTATADTASFSSNVTLSGYLAYNWLTFHIDSLYFDVDVTFDSDLSISAEVAASYGATFSYAPTALYYGLSVPGLVELGPQLQFGVDAYVSASAAVNITTAFGLGLADGNVHLDLLESADTTTSGWTPTYSASADISGQAVATLNPNATFTVELAISFFGGLLDLSSGVTAKPGFTNEFTLAGSAAVDLEGVSNTNSSGLCTQGLAIDSEFNFAVDAFVTEFYSAEVYSVNVPLLDECFSWA
ncbi:hypothetical protein LSUE1_G004827 [Lachnellula suecica]|uniref:Isoamyl alcohol oxidase n=1 Tax=Lachnellula suecica TaxID=602035 RepID=A0A8T9C7K3_9HELO|nr:hypothetical protein LSUE1_G004827 [Lachnellula suecica]